MSTILLWYTTRATGIVALVLLTGTVMLGVIGTARTASARWPRLVTAGVHRNLALTATAFTALHVLTTVLDPFASISLISALVPFSSDYRPLWLSLGAVAFDLLLAVMITSLLRDRLTHRLWQGVHLLVYVCWPVALWHGLGTGTDTRLTWVLAIDLACVIGIGWAVWWRLHLTEHSAIRTAGLGALILLPVLTLGFVLLGPLRPGWAERAGTPAALLGSHPSAAPPAAPSSLVDASFTGHLTVRGADDHRTITITGRTLAAREPVVIVLHGIPAGGGISLTSGTVRVGQAGTGYSGRVTALSGSALTATVAGPRTGQRRAEFVLHIHGSQVTGKVSLRVADGG